jgi:HD-GYP domain-containing protein (c-di-GMP phosphodiesterase class II)
VENDLFPYLNSLSTPAGRIFRNCCGIICFNNLITGSIINLVNSRDLNKGSLLVRYTIDDISDDMVLGESIYLPSGELLLATGYRIKERYRKRLIEMGYRSLLIEVEGTESVRPETTVSEVAENEMSGALDTSSRGLMVAIQDFRDQSSEKVKELIKKNKQHLNKYIMTTGIARALEQFVEEIMSQSSIVLNLSAMRQTQPSLFTHALNVTITALCIGKKYKLSYEEMKQLGIGALNYDLGLITLPKELLEKSCDDFTEAEMKLYRQHCVFGFIMLSQNHLVPSTSAAVALQHHEYQSGNGFPRGIKGDNRPPLKDFSRQNMIHRFAEIVAVADRYDACLHGRLQMGYTAMEVRNALKAVIEAGGEELNSDIVKTLVSIVPIFPVGARIRIVNAPSPQLIGHYGVVAKDNPENVEAPQIIIYESKNHQKIKPILIDLSRHSGFILELVV